MHRNNIRVGAVLALAVALGLGSVTLASVDRYSLVPMGTPPNPSGAVPGPPSAPQGGLMFFGDEASFQGAAGALVFEDFSNSSAEPGGVCSGPSPLNSSTNDACFSPGDVIDGFSLFGVPGDYVTLGTNFLGNPIPVAGPNTFTDNMDLTFSPAVSAVGFAVFGDLITPVNVNIDVFGAGGALLGSTTVTGTMGGTFVGITSADPIERLAFTEPAGGGELIGNLQFSGEGPGDDGGDDGGVPATSTWGVVILVALFMGASLYFLRRRSSAGV